MLPRGERLFEATVAEPADRSTAFAGDSRLRVSLTILPAMLPPPASPQVAALSGLAVAAGFLAVGYLVVEALAGARPYPQVIRIGLALPAALTIVLLLLLAHVATGGRVLSEPWVTRGAIGAIAVVGLALRVIRRRSAPGPSAAPLVAMAVVALLAIALWGFPATRLLPLDHAWDSDFHAGLANELINGETLPHGTVTGAIPNDYPWMYHTLLATTASFMPGGRARTRSMPRSSCR